MNSAKKALKNQDQNQKRLGDAGDKKNPIALIVIVAVVSLILIVGVAYDSFKPQNAVTIDGKKISIEKMMYNIWTTETQYEYMDQIYQMNFGSSYWDMMAGSGTTYRDQAKDEVMNQEIQAALMYQDALDAGYKLTEDEEKEVEEELQDILKMYSFWNRMRMGFTKSYLKKQIGRAKIVSRYREDLIEGFDVDDEEIKKDFKEADYKEYEIEYYSAPITEEDEDGNSITIGKKELSAVEEEMKDLRKDADTAEDFSKLLPEEESDDGEEESAESEENEASITYNSGSFLEKDGWQYASDKNCDIIKKLKVDEISDVIVDEESGYMYFVKLTDNTSTESYDEAVENAITEAENTAFDEWYEALKEKHKVKVNDKVWDTVEMGNVTTAIERQEVTEDSSETEESDDSDGDSEGEDEDAEDEDSENEDSENEDSEETDDADGGSAGSDTAKESDDSAN